MHIIITNDPEATFVLTFGQLLNLLTPDNTIKIRSNNEQLQTWSPFRIETKIKEITGLRVKVERQ
jgi:hypothetical protein